MNSSFRQLGALTNWVRGIACAIGIIVVCNIGIDLYVNHLLRLIRDGAVENPSLLLMGMHGANRLQMVLDVGYGVLLILNIVLFFIWLHRAASNTEALGAKGLESSPGWTVGWFFVPVANLVMPYRAMREVWQASRSPAQWSTVRAGPCLLLWWLIHLFAGIAGQVKSVMLRDAHGADAVLAASNVEITGMVLSLVTTLLFVHIVGSLWSMQEAAWSRQTPVLPPLPDAAIA